MLKRIPLGELCQNRIATIPASQTGGIRYIDISSINNQSKRIENMQVIEAEEAPSRAKQLVRRSDILVSTVRPNLNAVAIVDIDDEIPLVASTGYCVLRCKNEAHSRYVFHFCQSPYFIEDMTKQATGASYPAVSAAIVRNSLLPMPPDDEIQRISRILDNVANLISYYKAALDNLDLLVKSRFIEMFGAPETNPMGWKRITVQQAINEKIIDKPLDGNHGGKHPKTSDYVPAGVPFIMANDLVDGRVDLENCAFISREQADSLDKGFARDGDVLITHKGTIGRTAILHCAYPYIMLTPQVTYYRPIAGIIPAYLKAYFDTDYFQGVIGNIASVGSTRAYIGITAQQELPLLIPPVKKQEEYASFVEQTDKSKFVIQESLSRLETLKKSLMQQYFG